MAQSDEKTGLDRLLDADETDIQQLVENQGNEADVPLEETAPETPETPVEEPPPAVEPPAEEEPPAEPEKPPVEEPEKPAEQKVEAKPPEEKKPDRGDGYAWKELRRLRREQKEREAAEVAARAKLAEQPKPAETPAGEEDLDPIEQARREAAEARRKADELEQRLAENERRSNQRSEEQSLMSEIDRQEAQFKAKNPDYDDAMKHLIDARREQFDVMGKLDADASFLIEKNPEGVEQHARDLGLDPDDYNDIRTAAKDAAFKVAIHQERQQVIAYAKRNGRNIAETVYGLAQKMGYSQTPRSEAAPETKPQTAQERVQKAKESEERRQSFTKSLAAMDARPSPAPKKINSRAELMKMPDDQQDALIAKMDHEDPDWFKNLED